MPPVDPSNGGLSNVSIARIQSSSQRALGGLGRKNYDFCPIFGIPNWLMPLRDRSGQRWQPSGKPWSQRPKFVQGSLEPVPTSGAHTALTLKRGMSLGVSIYEVWFHRFSSPPFGSLSPLPLHILLFPLFLHVLLSSCLVISSFSSFACTLVPALVCTCTLHTCKHRLQVAQVFTMRWASSGVPVHLVPLSFQPHAPLSRLVLLSCLHSFVLCAHTCTLALTLALRLPSKGVCV